MKKVKILCKIGTVSECRANAADSAMLQPPSKELSTHRKHTSVFHYHRSGLSRECHWRISLCIWILICITGQFNMEVSANVGYGARPSGMAGAFTAVSNDSNAMPVNPAGLIQILNPEVTALYGRMYMNLSDDSQIGQGYFGFVHPLKKYIPGVIGVSWDEINLTDAYSETSWTISYARDIYKNISGGLNLKYLRKSYSSDSYTASDPLFKNGRSKSSFGIDLGCFYKIAPKYTAGLMLRNLNQPDMGIKNKDSLPVEYKAGVAYWMRNGVVDLDFGLSDRGFYSAIGSEYWLHKNFAGRLGFLIGNNDRRNFNIGFGSKFSMFYMDYAFTLPIGGISGTSGSHNISFSVKFGKIEKEISEEQLENLQKELSLSIEQMKKSQERAILQEKRIKELEEKLKQQQEIIKSFAVGEQPVQIIMPEVSTDSVKVLENQIEILKNEVIKSRREVEQFKAKIHVLEDKLRKKGEPKKIPETLVPPGLQVLPDGRKVYMVEKGDTLEIIAEKVYGDPSRWIEIYKANSKDVGRGGEVKPGQLLIIK